MSHTGKTYLAHRLMEKHHIPYISMDHIKMGMIRGVDTCGFCAEDSDEVITIKLWPVLKGIILTALENKQSLIMEGCYLPFDHMDDFPTCYHKQIISFYIGFSKAYIEQYFDDISTYRNIIERRLYPFEDTKTSLIKQHESLKKIIIQKHQTYFEINKDYQKEMEDIMAKINTLIIHSLH